MNFDFSGFKIKKEPILVLPSTIFQKMDFSRLQRKKEIVLGLDIGNEAVKAVIVKKEKEKTVVLGASLEYFDWFSVFDGREFEIDVLKSAVLKTIDDVKRQTGKKPKKILLGLPANILKGKIVFYSLKRKNPKKLISKMEEREIFQTVLRESQKALSKEVSKESGILPQDFHFLSSEIIKKKIDGYSVAKFYRYQGKTLDFEILFSFLPKYYWEIFQKKIFPFLDFGKVKIIPEWQSLQSFLKRENPEGVFVDVGGEITQVFLARNGKLEGISEFKGGGRSFSQNIRQVFGLTEDEARAWKENYSKEFFSEKSRERIKTIFLSEQRKWFLDFRAAIEKINIKKLFPPKIFLFGGGSLLPEISEILEKELAKSSFAPDISTDFEVKFLYPQDLKNVEFSRPGLNNPQFTPVLLNCYAYLKEIF